MNLSLWYLMLIVYASCSDPVVRTIAGPFETQEVCEAYYSTLPPPSPGSHYDCKRHVAGR